MLRASLQKALLSVLLVAAPALAEPRTVDEKKVLDAWFARYDELTAKGDVQGLTKMILFPVQMVSDDSKGNGRVELWTREQFIERMTEVMKGTPKDLKTKSQRKPFFLSNSLAIVTTEATFTTGGKSQAMRYADILVKLNGEWRCQTMVQAGWGDGMKAPPAAGN